MRLQVTFVASHSRVATLQWEMSPGVVVEGRGNPALRIVAIRTRRLSGLCKLAVMRVFMTILTDFGGAFELYLLLADRYLMAITTLHGPVRTEQRELGFRMVKAVDVRP